MARPPGITFSSVNLTTRGRSILRGVDLTMPAERITALMGPRGAGKSALLSVINHSLQRPFRGSGELLLGDVDIAPWAPHTRRENVARLRQRVATLLPEPAIVRGTLFTNVAIALRSAGIRQRDDVAERVEEGLHRAGIWDEARPRLHQPVPDDPEFQQAVCLARALALRPQVLLADEPTARLDWPQTRRFERVLRKLAGMMTVIVAVRLPAQAGRIADYAAVLMQGSVVEAAPFDDLWRTPGRPETERFLNGCVPDGGSADARP